MSVFMFIACSLSSNRNSSEVELIGIHQSGMLTTIIQTPDTQLFHHRPAASRLTSRKSFMRSHAARLVCEQQQTAALERQPDRVPASVKMGLEVAESLPAGSGED